MFDGREWESVEQCYQAMKFNDRSIQDAGQQMQQVPIALECAPFHALTVIKYRMWPHMWPR